GQRTQLFVAPDGELARLPLEVLPDGDGLLLDRYRITYLASGRDVLRLGQDSGRAPADPVVVSGPDYDYGLDTPCPTAAPPAEVSGKRSLDGALSALEFPPLDGAHEEGQQLARQLADHLGRRVEPLLGR